MNLGTTRRDRTGDEPAAPPEKARNLLAALLDDVPRTPAAVDPGATAFLGMVHGREVAACVVHGPVSTARQVLGRAADLATANGHPLLLVVDGVPPGIRSPTLQDQTAEAELVQRFTRSAGIVPRIAVVLGTCDGAWTRLVAGLDVVVIATDTAHLSTSDPSAVAASTGVRVEREELGGPTVLQRNGTADLSAPDGDAALSLARDLLNYLPQNNLSTAPVHPPVPGDDVPAVEPAVEADARRVGLNLLDAGGFLEFAADHAPNVACGLGRLDGAVVGVVATSEADHAGALTSPALRKAARFARFCDAFGLPLLTLVDSPGHVPDAEAERSGWARDAAALAQVYAAASVPLVTVVTGRAHGVAGTVLGARGLGADLCLAWPGATFDGGAGAWEAVEAGLVDAVTAPHRTAEAVRESLSWLRTKRRAPAPRRHATGPR